MARSELKKPYKKLYARLLDERFHFFATSPEFHSELLEQDVDDVWKTSVSFAYERLGKLSDTIPREEYTEYAIGPFIELTHKNRSSEFSTIWGSLLRRFTTYNETADLSRVLEALSELGAEGLQVYDGPVPGLFRDFPADKMREIEPTTKPSRIRLERRISGGGFADVWEAHDTVLERQVAAKIIRGSMEAESSALAHAKALARVSHTNVVQVFDVTQVAVPGENRMANAVIMELLTGATLADRRRGGPLLKADEVILHGSGVIDGVDAIHAAGIPHGDLHPGNVMLCDDATKVIDILRRDASSLISTATLEYRLQTDRNAVVQILVSILQHSRFYELRLRLLDGGAETLSEVKERFLKLVGSSVSESQTDTQGFQLSALVAIVGEQPDVTTRLAISGQNGGKSSVFFEAAGFRIRDGRTVALPYDAVTGARLLPREIKPGQKFDVWVDPEAIAERVPLEELVSAFFRDQLGQLYEVTEGELQSALAPWSSP